MNIVCVNCGHVWSEDGRCGHASCLRAGGRWWRPVPERRAFGRTKRARVVREWESLHRQRL